VKGGRSGKVIAVAANHACCASDQRLSNDPKPLFIRGSLTASTQESRPSICGLLYISNAAEFMPASFDRNPLQFPASTGISLIGRT